MRIVVPYLENQSQARLLFTFFMFSKANDFSKNFYFNYTTEYLYHNRLRSRTTTEGATRRKKPAKQRIAYPCLSKDTPN